MRDDYPLVTVVLPIRNEARHIARCLDAVLTQAYPSDKIQVIVVDGMSTDGTREIVARFLERDARVQLIDNPKQIVPTALNLGIRAARGEIIVRVDGHAVIAQDYLARCVNGLAQTDADIVGGPIRTIGENWVARGIAIAQSSPFGVGSAAFRYATRAQSVDTLAFGAHRREIFDRVGMFDEALVRNQDDEFNFRVIQGGGKIWLDPEIRSNYFSRATLRGLMKQYFEYGFWKVRVIQKHKRPASWRHLVPMVFVIALAAGGIASLLTRLPAWFLVVGVPYLIASFLASLWISARRGWQYAPLLPLTFATMHLAYGIGFLAGWLRFRGENFSAERR